MTRIVQEDDAPGRGAQRCARTSRPRSPAWCAFVKTSGQDFRSEEKFDAIVLNEVLYYFENPMQILENCRTFLKDDGVCIVSMYCSKETSELWKKIESVCARLEETKISNRDNTSWICKAYKSSKDLHLKSDDKGQGID